MSDFDIFSNDLKLIEYNKGVQELTPGEITSKYKYPQIFNSRFFMNLLKCFNTCEGKKFEEIVHTYVECHAKSCDTTDKQLEFVAAGAALLVFFIQKNWIGPDVLVNDTLSQISSFNTRSDILKQLIIDGEGVTKVVEVPEFLFISKMILEIAQNECSSSLVIELWNLRCSFIHQQILEEFSPQLFDKINSTIDKIKNEIEEIEEIDKNIALQYHLEFGRVFMYYRNIQNSKEELESAIKFSGLVISLSGALGKKTKFQTEDLAQLVLKVSINNLEDTKPPTVHPTSCLLPRDVKLDDDVRLDKVKYVDSTQSNYPDLTELQQGVLLAHLFQVYLSQPKDDLLNEEMQPLFRCILEQSQIWSFRMATLLFRSKLEASHRRTVERSLMQVQVLMDSWKDAEVSLTQKMAHFFISYSPTKWEIQLTLARILVTLGSVKSALEIYIDLEEWEDVIQCYNILQMRQKAQEVIEQELQKHPTPKLWCLLGDATDDISCYEKAWELSNHKSARAQRHWAQYYYNRKNYAESIEHFQKSLEINSLQDKVWYQLGFAALMVENWEISAQAYRRYCALDPESFEAWNNLGKCYIQLKQRYRAWKALQEALKIDYGNWKVWDNYMGVSCDLNMLDQVIKSYHEILNLKEKHVDTTILVALVLRFSEDEKEMEDERETAKKENREKLRSRILELFGRITSQVLNDSEVWFLYSQMVSTDSLENITKKHQLLTRAHSAAVSRKGWESDLETCSRVVYVLSELVEVGLLLNKPDILMRCKLAANGALAAIKKVHPDVDVCENLEKNLEKLEKALDG